MDTSQEYVKMCSQAEEIQKAWEPKEADLYYCLKTYDCSAGQYENTVHYLYCLSMYDYSGWATQEEGIDLERLKQREYFVFLPRQDQLQEMLPNKPATAGAMIDRMYTFWRNEFGPGYTDTMEKFLLIQVMKGYGKTWDGEKWSANVGTEKSVSDGK